MLSEQQVQEFQAKGYLRGGKVLSEEEVEVLREEMLRVIEDREKPGVKQPVMLHHANFGGGGTGGGGTGGVWQIVNIWEASEAYKNLISHSVIAEEMAQLTGAKTLRIWHDQIQYKPASVGGANMWHQDAPLWPILAPMTEVSAWVALDDVDPENGCMSMVPGSHLWGNHIAFLNTFKKFDDMPQEFEGRPLEVLPCPVRKGEVHYHHALTWHGSPANTSNRPRRAIALHYMTDETRFVASGQHVMKPFVEVADGEVMQGEHFPQIWPKHQ